MTTYTVRLEDDTIGTLEAEGTKGMIGNTAAISLHDENGNAIQAAGKVVEILKVREEWE